DRNEHRKAEQIGGDGDAQAYRIGMQRDRHLRQRRGDHGGIDLLHDDRRADDHGDDFGLGDGGHPGENYPRSARNTSSGVSGIRAMGAAPSGRNASFTAFMMQAGAPAVPASPAPLAPSSESAVGVTTWPISMSGISPAIGTRESIIVA